MPADPEELVALMPFARQFGVVVDEASADRVIARLDWAPHLCTAGGIMHGGALMALADTAGPRTWSRRSAPGSRTVTSNGSGSPARTTGGASAPTAAPPLRSRSSQTR